MQKELEDSTIEEMTQSGVLFSHKKSKAHPDMRGFIVGNRYKLDILDAGSVLSSLNKTSDFMEDILKNDGTILFVGTTASSRGLVEDLAKELGQPRVTNRWLGGTLTNFGVIRDRIDYYEELMRKREEGELEKYTKKEQVEFDKEIAKLEKKFEGLRKLENLPEAVFVVGVNEHSIAVKEARQLDIPVIAVVDTDDNPKKVDYPIIANDHTKSSLEWVFDNLKSELIANK